MTQRNHWLIALLVLATLQFWSCRKKDDVHHFKQPASILEKIEGSHFIRVTLTKRAMERLDIQTTKVIEMRQSSLKKVVPYSALLYGPEGQTWVYISQQPRVFVRYVVDVYYIAGDTVFLNYGPPVGTIVGTEGSQFSRVTLTESAMERLDIKTTKVIEMRQSSLRKVIPYSALLYGPEGQTWVYISPQPRVFVRYVIDVDYIEGDRVFLYDGPPVGTIVTTVGVAELYGTEFKHHHHF